ncbi:MAG: LytTR family DNA-binding domain-containing protein [Proteobacteria bacterium]|nr:LytTR family DNA-binding domain-containing protein [Pseudomonadota bacterium]
MNAVTALVAEDEVVLRAQLCGQLAALWPELAIVAQAENGIEALRLLERHRPDIAFLDIEMPGLSGLDVARQCQAHVVFVTAYDAHAVAAFEEGAIDYVLKPYDSARLAMTVRRLRDRVSVAPGALERVLRELAAAAPVRQHLRWINASHGGGVRLITVDEVCYFQADTKYTRVVTADGDALIRRSLKELQDELDPACFWPIHRSTIVNAVAIAGVSRDFRGRVRVLLKSRSEKLPVSEAHEHLFKQM